MADLQKALETQLVNIEKRSGKSLAELAAILKSSGLNKHGEMRDYLKRELGMGHGDANTFVHHFLGHLETTASLPAGGVSDVLADIYVGPKAALRPIHEALIEAIDLLGQYETAPKKGYVSLRRKKQFAMIGPATNTRVELGLNMKGVTPTDRLVEMKPGGMCNYKVKLEKVDEVDAEVTAWIRHAFNSAG
ncbi:MAG: DUF4287 domain-containing protein [Acidobacteria bacterium]|nr:DUF4287 domain-containing protein [Acidobacteriota bacterium]